ncbi:hypothetical protein RR48_11179 [Papilio machaon]|uniref:Agrin n=1 Tax=Papilio machaon TaxID=76193 RepID=A0A194QQ33_PAPMA|nr:hypothetical protein RR48_11179 [Papilio machaon]
MRLSLFIFLALFNALNVQPGYGQTLHQRSNCNVTYDRVLLKRVTLLSKYIFIGKVYAVKSNDNVNIYKVNIRRVLKGDLNDLSVIIRFGSAKSIRFSDATVLVQSTLGSKCPVLRVRNYAIFLTEKKLEEGVLRLTFVVDPVPLTLRNIGIIEAAIKGFLQVAILKQVSSRRLIKLSSAPYSFRKLIALYSLQLID